MLTKLFTLLVNKNSIVLLFSMVQIVFVPKTFFFAQVLCSDDVSRCKFKQQMMLLLKWYSLLCTQIKWVNKHQCGWRWNSQEHYNSRICCMWWTFAMCDEIQTNTMMCCFWKQVYYLQRIICFENSSRIGMDDYDAKTHTNCIGQHFSFQCWTRWSSNSIAPVRKPIEYLRWNTLFGT